MRPTMGGLPDGRTLGMMPVPLVCTCSGLVKDLSDSHFSQITLLPYLFRFSYFCHKEDGALRNHSSSDWLP
jgi:hypothetical protein